MNNYVIKETPENIGNKDARCGLLIYLVYVKLSL